MAAEADLQPAAPPRLRPPRLRRLLRRAGFVRLRDLPVFLRSLVELSRLARRHEPLQAAFARQAATRSFTTWWFLDKIPVWMRHVVEPAPADMRYLEIGAWEGLSALFIRQMKPDACMTCIDTWEGSDEQRRDRPDAVAAVERRFDANIGAEAGVTKLKGLSSEHLGQLVAAGARFDVIYVDGSHHSHDVLVDCLLAWKLLDDGGVLVGDDYLWAYGAYRRRELPHRAYRHFLDLIDGEYRLLHLGKQLFLRKMAGPPC